AHPDPAVAARATETAFFGGPQPNFATEAADRVWRRGLLQPHFTPKQLRSLVPRVDALTTRLLDDLAANGTAADLYAGLALPLPILAICELLGVPYADSARFRAWTIDAGDTRDRARSEHGFRSLFGYAQQLVARKRRAPGDDVISRLCATDGLSDDEAANLSMGLLFAGYESVVAHIGLGALLLLANAAHWRALAADPGLASTAVEEILRTARSIATAHPRYARTDLEINGVTVSAGDLVLLSIGAANRDRSVFTDPDRIDISRPPTGHLSFGHGARYCIGAPLARMELAAVFSQLAPRFPTMRLAVAVEELAIPHGMFFGGLTELPVRW
ncbi:MAG: cytochrome P450, partial [Mycobacterium sp.]